MTGCDTKEQLTKSDILYYLEQINIHLRNKSKYGEIIIAGGAALTLAFEARDVEFGVDKSRDLEAELEELNGYLNMDLNQNDCLDAEETEDEEREAEM